MSKSSAMAVITPEDVLETLMNDGTIDTIRSKIINHLKANEELKNSTISMVEQSKVLHTPGSEKQTKRELFDALRQELESPALERASKSVWDLILDNDGFGKEINQTVERAFCLLSGCHPPLFPIQHDPSPSLPPAPDSTSVAEENSSEAVMTQRCARTDGKNWRCAKFCVPEERYCERHIHISSKRKSPKTKQITDSSTPNPSTKRSEDHNRRKRKSTALKMATCDVPVLEPVPVRDPEPEPELQQPPL
ncbi:hypothetical protein ACHQM5_025727 [Ranunculus cassubicifolius]